ncbi:MAG: class I SAM-dependent DNA methyltransferase [Selenomonadaceae bacterium]|nr:class I SAM-dependent DNA methyltransferase [Selenomonadaceae bacterium]
MQKQNLNAKKFAARWAGRGRERGESQSFWLSLLSEVYGVQNPDEYIRFEEPVQLSHKSFIDGFIDATHTMIEQKSCDKDLNEPIKQSDGTFLTPYQQAKRYAAELPYSKRPRWIIACNFKEFHIYDMENPQAEPEIILLENLATEYYRLNFLVDKTDDYIRRELELSIKAGEIVGRLYDALKQQYINPESDESLKSLNKLCVRLVFCLYAESAGIFGRHKMFRDYLNYFRGHNVRRALMDLFTVLNQPIERRDPYLDEKLAAFPYVNGGLFSEDNIEIPNFTQEILNLLIEEASSEFNWSGISPTIFGAVFESTLNPVTRRSGGMHYTSIENIHKVIDPLFMNDLHAEFTNIKSIKTGKVHQQKLQSFQDKLASLKFLDPACGSGNFLTETYLSLRRLENEVLKELIGTQITLGELNNPIKVSISQFYGIEINDFAVTVAKTALWIAESQMMAETINIVHRDMDFLPLKTTANIEEGNALRIDWHAVAPNVKYIMGNPPFVGKKEQSSIQKADTKIIFAAAKGCGNLDYVSNWYVKAVEYMKGTNIKAAFVSTNSITQGEQVPILWSELFNLGVELIFAHRTFKWDSESNDKAAVHCVIVGFTCSDYNEMKRIFDDGSVRIVKNINPYLVDAPNVFINSRAKPICEVKKMYYGNMPIDKGYLILNDDNVQSLLKENPDNETFIRKYIGGEELIHNTFNHCLWLKGVSPQLYRKSKFIMSRIQQTKIFRENSSRPQTQKLADTPYLFGEIRQPETTMLAIPKVSSENRKYIPIAFVKPEIIVSGSLLFIPAADLFDFGILISNVHNAWTRAVCGRLEMRYQYSASIVYNNFVWCNPSENQYKKIEATAQGILDARALYPDSSLADLYDERSMPPELRKAHQANDRAVLNAYGFDKSMTESEIVAELMKLYQKLAKP